MYQQQQKNHLHCEFPIKYNCMLEIAASSWNVFASSP